MRNMARNGQEVWYALYTGSTDVLVDGHRTGEKQPTYGTPVKMYASVSASSGSADVQIFGVGTDYSRTMMTCDLTCPISETSRVWIGKSTSLPHNYVVTKVAKSLNSITYALKEVDVGA